MEKVMTVIIVVKYLWVSKNACQLLWKASVIWGVEQFIGMIAAIRFAQSVTSPYKSEIFRLDLYVNSISKLYYIVEKLKLQMDMIDE